YPEGRQWVRPGRTCAPQRRARSRAFRSRARVSSGDSAGAVVEAGGADGAGRAGAGGGGATGALVGAERSAVGTARPAPSAGAARSGAAPPSDAETSVERAAPPLARSRAASI